MMKKATTILFGLSFLLVLWANGETHSSPMPKAIPDGMYMIKGVGSGRCLDIPNGSCGYGTWLQTFACDPTDASNSQKFNVVADGTGYYTITAAHSDLCLEVGNPESGKTPIIQSACSPGKATQKWAMDQYGDNLEIRAAVTKQCMDVGRAAKKDYGEVNEHLCNNGTNQRWQLFPKTFNRNGVVCRASPSHPELNCYGVNDKQSQVYLGKTLTKARCAEVCTANKMASCQWEGPQ